MIPSFFRRSIRGKLMLVILVTTISALVLTGVMLVLYDLQNYETATARDLITQADLIGQASAPALTFLDPETARTTLELLRVRARIEAAALYTLDGRVFASYVRPGLVRPRIPEAPGEEGHRVAGGHVETFRHISDPGGPIGTVYVRAEYDLGERLATYLAIVAGAMVISLLVAVALSYRLQSAVTGPILAIGDVARRVKTERDYSRRAIKTSEDELGELVEAFNAMLAEVDTRTAELEAANRMLEQEMTVRRDAELALLDADRRKDAFLAMLAHELRNPLAPIGNSIRLLQHGGLPESQAQWARDVIARQVQHLTRLVDDLIDVSRITRNKLVLQKTRVALGEVIAAAIQSSRPAIESGSHHLEVSVPHQPIWVEADVVRLTQVFMNLLNNAAKYTPREGRITLVAERNAGHAVVTVRDDGIGIDPEKLPRLFDLFYQADSSIERSRGGLGIGLSLVRQLVELHGGDVIAASDGPGRGSSFTVTLPLSADQSGSSRLEVDEDHGVPQPVPGRILVVDDNHDAASSLAMLLQIAGNEVHTAADGLEAVEAAARLKPKVILLDIGLPKLDGYGAARRIREQAWSRDAVLIALTGWGQAQDRERSRAAGINHHLVKPVDYAALMDLLKDVRAVTS